MTPIAEARIRAAFAALADELIDALEAEAAAGARAPDTLLSIPAAAERLGIARSKLYGLIASGDLGSLTVGRRRLVPSAAIAGFIADRQADR